MQGFAANRVWCLIVALACDLLAFSQLLAMADAPTRAWEPQTIRLRLMTIPAPWTRGTRLLPATTLKEEPSGPWKGPTTARRHAASRHTQPV